MKVAILLGIAYVLSATYAQDSTFEIVCNSNPLMTKQVDNLHNEVDSLSQNVNNMKGQVDQVQLMLENQTKEFKLEMDKLAKTKQVEELHEKVDSVAQTVDPVVQTVDSVVQTVNSIVQTVDPVVQTVDSLVQTVNSVAQTVDSLAQTVNTVKEQVDQVQLLSENQTKDFKVEVDKLAKMLEKVIENIATIWRPLKTGTYAFLGEPRTWYEAKEKCKEIGGYLVEINSQEEQGLVVRTSQALGWDELKLHFWLGLNDIEKEGTWIWDHSQRGVNDGFSNWHAGQPDGSGGNEHCGGSWRKKWNDYPCDYKKKLGEEWTPAAVCERDG